MKSFLKQCILRILTIEARIVLKKYRPKIAVVVGSVGKTSVKNGLYAVLADHVFVRKSERVTHGQVGILLTILGCRHAWLSVFRWVENILTGFSLIVFRREYPEWLVLEAGVERPGDTSTLARWLRPDVLVVTSFPDVPSHVEFFESPEALIEEKSLFVDALQGEGLLIVNADDARVSALAERFRGQTVTCGFGRDAHIRATSVRTFYKRGVQHIPEGISARVHIADKDVSVRLHGVVGEQAIFPVLSGFALGAFCGIPLLTAAEAFEHYLPPPGRMRILAGLKQTTIIDDTYNSSPIAAARALDTFRNLRANRRFAVLGDMLEIGKFSPEEHKKLGRRAAQCVDMLCTVGLRARGISEGALDGGMTEDRIFQFEEAREAGAFLQNKLVSGDAVLVKGSQMMRMERTVEEIMARPELKGLLLVRQDPEWLSR